MTFPINAGIVEKTVWLVKIGDEWQAQRLSGEVVACDRYQERLMRKMRRVASDPGNGVYAVAIVQNPIDRRPTSNKPPTSGRLL